VFFRKLGGMLLMIHNAVGNVCETFLEDGMSSSAVTEDEGLAPAIPNLSQALLVVIFLSSAQVILPRYTCYLSISSAFQLASP
jgi:hypothetical protein